MDAKEKIEKLTDFFMNLGKDKESSSINLAQIARVEKWYIEVENDIFAIGNKVIRKWWDNETEPLAAGEYELEDGQKMMVDSSGVITTLENEVQLNTNKVDIKEQEKLQASLELAVTEKEALQKELDALKLEAEKKTTEETELAEEAKLAEKSEIEKLSETVEALAKTVTELAKQPVVVETVEEDLTKLSFADRMVAEDNLRENK